VKFCYGLRQLALEHNFALCFTDSAKLKRSAFATWLLLINPYQALVFKKPVEYVEFVLVAAATGISLFSAKNHFDISSRSFFLSVSDGF